MKLLAPTTTDVNQLCDWAEVQSLLNPRRPFTVGDIQGYVKGDDVAPQDIGPDDEDYDELDDIDELREPERDERLATDVLEVARDRAQLLGSRYPLRVNDKGLGSEDAFTKAGELKRCFESYVYYLLLSALESSSITPDDRHFFELECSASIASWSGTERFHFGWTKHNSALGKIEKRVNAFCKVAKLGLTKKTAINPAYAGSNDLEIDIVCWKPFVDRRENTLILIGQCASGQNWDGKLASNAGALLSDLMHESPSAPVLRVFCLPFVVPTVRWRKITVESSSIVCDRIRLSSEIATKDGTLHEARNSKWVRSTLSKVG